MYVHVHVWRVVGVEGGGVDWTVSANRHHVHCVGTWPLLSAHRHVMEMSYDAISTEYSLPCVRNKVCWFWSTFLWVSGFFCWCVDDIYCGVKREAIVSDIQQNLVGLLFFAPFCFLTFLKTNLVKTRWLESHILFLQRCSWFVLCDRLCASLFLQARVAQLLRNTSQILASALDHVSVLLHGLRCNVLSYSDLFTRLYYWHTETDRCLQKKK